MIHHTQPTAEELLWAFAKSMVELEAAQVHAGRTPITMGRMEFTKDDLAVGRSLKPEAWIEGGILKIRLDT